MARELGNVLARGEARDRDDQVEVAAELVHLPEVPRDERGALVVGEVQVADGRARVLDEPRAEVGILLEPIEQAVDGIAAHASLHSTAARLIRRSSPN